MSIYDKQIRRRMENDRKMMEESLFQMGRVVLDKWSENQAQDGLFLSKNELDKILKYYHEKPTEIPESITDPEKQLAEAFRPSGLMMRDIILDERWYKKAYGPMLGYFKENNTAVALIPGTFSGYWYEDPSTGKKTRVNKKNGRLFSADALCFYRPLPAKELGIRDLLEFLWQSVTKGDIFLIVIASLAVTLVGMLEPRIYRLLTGSVLQSHQVTILMGVGTFLIAAAFAGQMISLVRNLLLSRLTTKTNIAVESAVMMRLLMLPVSFFRNYSSGELSNRVGSVHALCNKIIRNVLSVGLSSLMSLLYITQIFSYAPVLAWPSIGIVLAITAVSVTASLVQIRITREKMLLNAKENGFNLAMLSGMQKIKISGAEKRAFAKWGKLYAKSAQLEYNPPVFLKLNTVITAGISLFGAVLLYYLAIRSGVDQSEYFAFSAAYGHVVAAFTALSGIAASVAGIRPVLEMAEPVLKTKPEADGEKESATPLKGNIEVNHVSFRYEDNQDHILKDLSLHVKAGEYVAIVGRTGCGKSTLIRLLLGFEKPETGTILFDQNEVGAVDPGSLRRQIGVVLQDGQLIRGDLFSNITIAAPDLKMEDAWEAAETAGIADDIRRMPMGMNTIVSEGEGDFSGGQKQRLMIARAIAPKPKILIFDEATSALDNKTQKQISDALDKMQCTRIVIAHRLSTIRHCDRILMLDGGTIIEEGTYEELIEKDGAFAEMVSRQRL